MDAFIPKNVYKGPLEVPHAEEEIFTSGLIAVNVSLRFTTPWPPVDAPLTAGAPLHPQIGVQCYS